ncbi:uncharacterized protein [Palaemon carinicauda]|uniref:uncharacterized protein n=1 Tax=Palaemon carinicauda TaxID=392227 RepID=UPI0035B673C2
MGSLKFHIRYLLWTFLHLSIVIGTIVSSADPLTKTDHSTGKLPRILRRRDKIEETKETEPIVDTIQQPLWPATSEFQQIAKENTDDALHFDITSEARRGTNNDPTKPCTSKAQTKRLDYVESQDLPMYRTSNPDIQTFGLPQGQDSLVPQTRIIRNKGKIGVHSPSLQTSRITLANVQTIDSEKSYANQISRATTSTNQVTDGVQIPNTKMPLTVYTNIETIGGVGNPSLQGIPMSLDDTVFLIQSNNRTVTEKPIYGGIGAEFLPLSVDVEGIRSIHPNREFYTIPNKAPYPISPSTNPTELFPNFTGVPIHKNSGQNLLPVTNRPISISSLIDIVKNLTSRTRNNSAASTPSPYVVNPHSYSYPDYINNLPNFSLPKKTLPSGIRINKQEENLDHHFWKEYEENSNDRQSFQFENVLPLLHSNKEFQNHINNFSNFSINKELPLRSSFKNSDESPTGINSIRGCLNDTWCGLGIAAAVAFGTVSALAVPFLAPPAFGRRRKSIEYVFISIDNASSFAKHYMSMLQNNTCDVPYEEKMLFIALHDSENNSTRDTFDKIKDLILNNRDILLPTTDHQLNNAEKSTDEDSEKNQIPIPDSILNKINEKSEDRKSKFPTNKQAVHNGEDERTSLKEDTNWSQLQKVDILPGLSDNAKQTPQVNFPSNFPESAISSQAKDVNNVDIKIFMDKILPTHDQDVLYLPPRHNLALEGGQNKGTHTNLEKKDWEISDGHSSFHPRQRVPNPYYIQAQKVGANPEPLSIPYQLYQNENHKYSIKSNSPHAPLGSSGSILQRLTDRLTGNIGQSHTQHSLPLQANFPVTNLASQIGDNSRYSPINILDTQPERQPLPVGSNIYTPFSQSQNPLLMNNFKISPFSNFGLNHTPVNIANYYDTLRNHHASDLRNTAIKNALPTLNNQVTSTHLPQVAQDQPAFGQSSILLNLPVHFSPNQQVNNLNNVNHSSQIHLKPKPHLPNSLSISNLLNRITRYPSRLNGSLKPITNKNPAEMAHPSNSLPHQILRPSQVVPPQVSFSNSPSQVSFSSSPKPTQTNKIPHLFTTNPYNSYSYLNPAYSTSGNPHLVPLKDSGQTVNPHAKGFYRSVCSAVGHKDVPDSDIIRFIREKCTIFQYTGII